MPDIIPVIFCFQITDFGLSYVLGGIGSDYMMQQACGTPMYMGKSVMVFLFSCLQIKATFTRDRKYSDPFRIRSTPVYTGPVRN